MWREALAKALVITEKPSVARDIAAALGGFTEHEGYWESDTQVLTFAVGHLFELLEPEEIDAKYKRWTLDVLPILPESSSSRRRRARRIASARSRSCSTATTSTASSNACDAGREGELIFREIVELPRIDEADPRGSGSSR